MLSQHSGAGKRLSSEAIRVSSVVVGEVEDEEEVDVEDATFAVFLASTSTPGSSELASK
jgi:hypothetical protein